MPEMSGHHELQGLRGASGVPGDHWITRHNLTNRRSVRVQPFSSDLKEKKMDGYPYLKGIDEPYMLNPWR
jgi:hypothetical protein